MMRTVEPHGLLFYNGGKPGAGGFIALEVYDGLLWLVMDVGDGPARYRFSDKRVDDGKPHKVGNCWPL